MSNPITKIPVLKKQIVQIRPLGNIARGLKGDKGDSPVITARVETWTNDYYDRELQKSVSIEIKRVSILSDGVVIGYFDVEDGKPGKDGIAGLPGPAGPKGDKGDKPVVTVESEPMEYIIPDENFNIVDRGTGTRVTVFVDGVCVNEFEVLNGKDREPYVITDADYQAIANIAVSHLNTQQLENLLAASDKTYLVE